MTVIKSVTRKQNFNCVEITADNDLYNYCWNISKNKVKGTPNGGKVKKMLNVKINEEDAIDLLVERVKFWTQDETTIELFEKMYNNYIYSSRQRKRAVSVFNKGVKNDK